MNIQHIKESYARMGKNFITPDVLKWDIVGNRVVELSEGQGMSGEDIYGVSEFEYIKAALESTKRGQMFTNKKEAIKYYQSLLKN